MVASQNITVPETLTVDDVKKTITFSGDDEALNDVMFSKHLPGKDIISDTGISGPNFKSKDGHFLYTTLSDGTAFDIKPNDDGKPLLFSQVSDVRVKHLWKLAAAEFQVSVDDITLAYSTYSFSGRHVWNSLGLGILYGDETPTEVNNRWEARKKCAERFTQNAMKINWRQSTAAKLVLT
jgi:hypothetical protein